MTGPSSLPPRRRRAPESTSWSRSSEVGPRARLPASTAVTDSAPSDPLSSPLRHPRSPVLSSASSSRPSRRESACVRACVRACARARRRLFRRRMSSSCQRRERQCLAADGIFGPPEVPGLRG
jgi:hypothetical protein